MFANIILTLLLATTPANLDAPTAVAGFMNYLESIAAISHNARSDLIRERYRTMLSSLDPASVADGDMERLFLATLTASGLANDRGIAAHARAIFDEMARRSLLGEKHYAEMERLYVDLRDFEAAHLFRTKFEGEHALDAIPEVSRASDFDPVERSILAPAGTNVLQRRNFDLPQADFVLVIAGPLCHFTRDAATAIQADPQLREYFSQHARWLAPAGVRLDTGLIDAWETTFPDYPLVLVDNIDTWPDIDYWGTPTFYFFEHGKVVRSIRGWPKEGRADELKEVLGITRTGR